MGRGLCVVAGVLSIAVGVAGLFYWWPSFLLLLKAMLPPILVMGGLVAVAAGLMKVRQ